MFDEDASHNERLVWDEVKPANSEPPTVHYHPRTEERFEVKAGRLVVELDGEAQSIEAGQGIRVPPGTQRVSYTEADAARFGRAVSPPVQ